VKFVLHKNGVQLIPETQLDVELLESWECKRFRANDMAIIAMATGVKRYPNGLFITVEGGE